MERSAEVTACSRAVRSSLLFQGNDYVLGLQGLIQLGRVVLEFEAGEGSTAVKFMCSEFMSQVLGKKGFFLRIPLVYLHGTLGSALLFFFFLVSAISGNCFKES